MRQPAAFRNTSAYGVAYLCFLTRQPPALRNTSACGVAYVSAATRGVPQYVIVAWRICFSYAVTPGVPKYGPMFLFVSWLRQFLSRHPYVSLWRGACKCGNARRSAIHPPVAWRILVFLWGNPWRSDVRSYVSVRQLAASVFVPSPARQPVAWRTLSYSAAARDL